MNKNAPYSPTMLVILDGFGFSTQHKGNAIENAHMPVWHKLVRSYPHTLLHASGEAVGLLPGYMGNSEVGHLTLGSGRIVASVLKKFHDVINDGTFFSNNLLLDRFNKLKKNGGALHIMGLVSDGGVHSHEAHVHAFIKLAADVGLKDVYIHAFLDGRDVLPTSAHKYLERLDKVCETLKCGVLASIHGRFYAMDRDKNWARTAASYHCLCGDSTTVVAERWQDVLERCYAQGITDEFIEPMLLHAGGKIKAHDGIVFFNFRPDRARQLTESFINPQFNYFEKQDICSSGGTLTFFVSTTRYKDDFENFKNDILFKRELVDHTLLDEIALQTNKQKKVFSIAETEKYAHVTYFFRGMVDKQLSNEERVLVPSIKRKTYIDCPQMSAATITQYLVHSLEKDPAFFYLVNYANLDMVGHSGDFKATVQACQIVDQQLGILYQHIVEQLDGTLFIVGDHGNAEEKIDITTGMPKTAHTCNPVPFLMATKNLLNNGASNFSSPIYGLANVAPTILRHLGLTIPNQMAPWVTFE